MQIMMCLAGLVTACAPAPASPAGRSAPRSAADAATPLTFGETFRLRSEALGEDRTVNVHLPPGYAEGQARFPVLFALDGGIAEDFPHVAGVVDVSIRNEIIRPLIVVGIENTERRRDLLGPTAIDEEREIAPHAGGADRFRRFLREELRPEIARRYRTSGETAIVGESFAGLFVIETLLVEPDLFDGYIAIDPSVWWNGDALVKSAGDRASRWRPQPKRLFVATADYAETIDGVRALMTAIRDGRPEGLVAEHAPFPAEHHGTIFPVAEARAYRALFGR